MQQGSKTNTIQVVGGISFSATMKRRVGSQMRKLITKALVSVALMVAVLFAITNVASATNSHQDHKGACARSTTSIREGVEDLRFNGVIGQFADAVGFSGINGSLSFQMEHRLVIARVKRSVTAANHGCDGSGGVFGAGPRVLEKGEKVAAKLPAKYSPEELCSGPSSQCQEVTFIVHVVFPASCWNLNEATIELVIFIRKPKKHTAPLRIRKTTVDGSNNQFPMPTGIFKFKVTAKGYPSKTVTLFEDPQAVGNYKIGTKGMVEELTPSGNDQWELVNKKQPFVVKSKKGLTLTFKNKEKSTPKQPETPSTPPVKTEIPPITIICGGVVIVGNGNSGNTSSPECNCNHDVESCNENHEPPSTCPPGTEGTPPNCHKPPEPPTVKMETIQEIEVGEVNRTICAKVDPPIGDNVTVHFDAEFGTFTNGGMGTPQTGTDRYCNGTYRPPSAEPPHVCVEEIASDLPPGTKCDIVTVLVQSSNDSEAVKVEKEVPIVAEKPF